MFLAKVGAIAAKIGAKLAEVAGDAVAYAEGDGLDTFISTITGSLGDFTTGTLAKVLIAALGITAVLAICWFAYRFIVRKTSGALKKGKL